MRDAQNARTDVRNLESGRARATTRDPAPINGSAEDHSRRFDYKVIRRRYDEIRAVKASGDPHALLYYLSEGIHGNTGGMGRPAVYARAKFGTKDLITNYIAEVADAIEQAARSTSRSCRPPRSSRCSVARVCASGAPR